MDDSQIIKYLNNLNITTFGFMKNLDITNRLVYWFQGRNDQQEIIEGNIVININGVDIAYTTLKGVQHLFECKFAYVDSNNYDVRTIYSTIENGQQNIINFKKAKNTPKADLFKNIFDKDEEKSNEHSKKKIYALV